MAIPSWAVEALRRGVGGVMDKVPPDTMDQLRKRANDLLSELPQSAARGVDSVMRGAKAGKENLQRWTRRHVALVTPVVNASGCLCHPTISGMPLSNEAVEIAAEALQAGSLTTSTARDRLARRLSRCVESSEWGILITTSVDGACLAIATVDRQAPIYFHRSQSVRLPSGTPIPDAIAAGTFAGEHRLREIGSVGGLESTDVSGIGDRAVLVAVDNGSGSGIWFRPWIDSPAASASLTRVVYLPAATWKETEGLAVSPALPAVLKTLRSDADIVITPGDGVLGGPRCGLIVVSKAKMDALVRSPIWPALVADPSTQAAMTLTLEASCSQRSDDVPVQAMLRTHEDNLRSRAERLATRVAAEPSIRSCQITADAATISPAGLWTLPSRQLHLAHRDWSASDWATRLIGEVPAVVAGVTESAIVVDLRWIQPSDDAALVATLVGHQVATENAPA